MTKVFAIIVVGIIVTLAVVTAVETVTRPTKKVVAVETKVRK
jgi:hypothetical protein